MDKYILITNANSNLGNEIVKKLIAENYIVFAGDASYENKEFGNLIYLHLDPKNKQILSLAKKYIQRFTSKINSIIHLGFYVSYASLVECEAEELEKSFEKNFFSAFKINQEFWDLVELRTGKIIHNCSDVSAFELAPFNGVYSLGKSLLNNYVDILRRELGFRGINVVKIHAGIIKDENFEEIRESYYNASEASKYFYSEISRFIDINIDREALVEIDEYADFVIQIVKQRRTKPVYYLKVNKQLKKISKYPKNLVDRAFKNYNK